jgi:hypothetical protein
MARFRPLVLLVPANCCSQASNEVFSLTAVVNGLEMEFQLRTKKDKVLPKSIITKEKADLTQGTIVELPASMVFKDSNGVIYPTQSSITLRCAYGSSPQTFDETFYVVQSCELDALLRRNISQGQLKDEPSCLPLKWGRKTQGV